MLAARLDGAGSVTYGVGLTLLGLCYVAVSLVAAQLSTSARGALGIAGAAIAVGYVVRGVGAMQDSALVWASPFGWAQRMDAFGAEQWWPALLLVTTTAALMGLAAWLTVHRDLGGGVLQARPGRPRSSALLGTPVGLALRLHRGLLVGWAIGLTALGLLYGAVIPTIPDLVASNPDLSEAFGAAPDAEQGLIDAFLHYIYLFMAVLSIGFVVTSVLRLRAEEESGRAEAVLATRVTRTSWMSATVLGLAAGYGLSMGEWDQVAHQVGGQLTYLPGVFLMGALTVALVGWCPRWSALAWFAVAFVFFQVILGETLRLPAWIDGISPFWHLSEVPIENLQALPAVIELALAAILVLLGIVGHQRRDVGSS
jgi:ABC-2 type transport system permease protein